MFINYFNMFRGKEEMLLSVRNWDLGLSDIEKICHVFWSVLTSHVSCCVQNYEKGCSQTMKTMRDRPIINCPQPMPQFILQSIG